MGESWPATAYVVGARTEAPLFLASWFFPYCNPNAHANNAHRHPRTEATATAFVFLTQNQNRKNQKQKINGTHVDAKPDNRRAPRAGA